MQGFTFCLLFVVDGRNNVTFFIGKIYFQIPIERVVFAAATIKILYQPPPFHPAATRVFHPMTKGSSGERAWERLTIYTLIKHIVFCVAVY